MSSYLKSERHFRLYEPYLRQIVEAWPAVVTFEPKAPVASTATLETRIRICKNALKEHLSHDLGNDASSLWLLGDFPVQKFLNVVDEIVVSSNAVPGKVVCGPEDLVRKRTASGFAAVDIAHDQVVPQIDLDKPELDLVMAVIVLHHYRLLTEPSRLRTGFDIQAIINDHHYDVAIEKEGDKYTIL